MQYIPTNEVIPTETQIDLADLANGWQPGLTVNDVGCTHTVYVNDDYTKAIRLSQPDGMPGPAAFEEWKSTPMDVHVYHFVKGNEMEAQMAFDRWVVEYAHNAMRRECGYGPLVGAQ